MSSLKEQLVIVAGGGAVAKTYIHALKPIAENEFYLDELGIQTTRLNAYALLLSLKAKGVNAAMANGLDALGMALYSNKVAVLAGQFPGISTDSDAVLACEALGCKVLVNISSTGYVYDKPPEYANAAKLKLVSHEKLLELASKYDTRESKSAFVFDMLACKLAKRSNIEIRFVDSSIENIRKALTDRKFEGTLVKG